MMEIEKIKALLKSPLPGVEAQMKMAPLNRGKIEDYQLNAKTRESGVLLLLYPKREILHIVLILRPIYDGVHSGQIAFPGGKMEQEDDDIVATALRETEEEVGVKRSELTILGSLTKLYIPPSNSLVTPSVAYSPIQPRFIPDAREVAAVIETPVQHFVKGNHIQQMDIKVKNGMLNNVPYYALEEHKIWGATAMMISEFTEVIRRVNG